MNNEDIFNKIKWASYKEYEGPVYIGKYVYSLPSKPTLEQKCMFLISKLEGNIDSINMYDRGIVSVGTLQWIESTNLSVSDMIGKVAEGCGIEYVKEKLKDALELSSADFRKNHLGKWRFFLKFSNNKESQVDHPSLQTKCFLSTTGKKGDWNEKQIHHAKTWCAGFAALWDSQKARDIQIEFTFNRLFNWYVTKNAKNILFSNKEETGYAAAAKALFLCFSVNIPQQADKYLELGSVESKNVPYTKEWYFDIFRKIVLGSNISLWRLRYDRVIKSLNNIFNVDFPESSNALLSQSWNVTSKAENIEKENMMQEEVVLNEDNKEKSINNIENNPEIKNNVTINSHFKNFIFVILLMIIAFSTSIKDCIKQ